MPLTRVKIAVGAIALTGCFAAQALFSDTDKLASTSQLEQLAQQLAICPELSSNVANALDNDYGNLSNATASGLITLTKQCENQRRQLPESARARLAYAALSELAEAQTIRHDTRQHQTPALNLKLSASLTR